jgi:cytosine/uracil/thiamine/allantoin permease
MNRKTLEKLYWRIYTVTFVATTMHVAIVTYMIISGALDDHLSGGDVPVIIFVMITSWYITIQLFLIHSHISARYVSEKSKEVRDEEE